MSYEEALEEWKKRDPYLTDLEGFQRFLEFKQKEVSVKVEVTVAYDGSFQIGLYIPYEDVPEEYKWNGESQKRAERITELTEALKECLEKIGLRKGATWVWKYGGEWVYSGDFTHVNKEDIDHNAKLLYKLWRTVGFLIEGSYGMEKAYDKSLYINIDLEKNKDCNIILPPFTILKSTPSHQYDEIRNTYEEPVLSLKTEEPQGEIWDEISTYAKALRLLDLKDEPDWSVTTDLPALFLYAQNVPEIAKMLKRGSVPFDPEHDVDVQRNGGLEMLHPLLRREMIFSWKNGDVVWGERAEKMRELYYHRFSLDELEPLKVAQLREIARAKGLDTGLRKDELITEILKSNAQIEPPP